MKQSQQVHRNEARRRLQRRILGVKAATALKQATVQNDLTVWLYSTPHCFLRRENKVNVGAKDTKKTAIKYTEFALK